MNAVALDRSRVERRSLRNVNGTEPIDSLLTDFSTKVGAMAEHEKGEVSELIEQLLHELRERPANPPKVHPVLQTLILGNAAAIIGVVAWFGSLSNQVAVLKEQQARLMTADTISVQINDMRDSQRDLKNEVEQLKQRLERFLDRNARQQ